MQEQDYNPFCCPICRAETTESRLARPQDGFLLSTLTYYRVCHACCVSFRVPKIELGAYHLLKRIGLESVFIRTIGRRNRHSMLYIRRSPISQPEVENNIRPARFKEAPVERENPSQMPVPIDRDSPPFLLEVNNKTLGFKFHVSFQDSHRLAAIARSLISATVSIGTNLSRLVQATRPPTRLEIYNQKRQEHRQGQDNEVSVEIPESEEQPFP